MVKVGSNDSKVKSMHLTLVFRLLNFSKSSTLIKCFNYCFWRGIYLCESFKEFISKIINLFFISKIINPLFPNAPFLYPPKKSENLTVF